ncbi:glycosyltransferase family 2 protein [Thermophilibacter sp.]
MRVRTAGTCRGDGKIYTRLSISGLAQDAQLKIAASGRNGEAIPCNMYPLAPELEPMSNGDALFVVVLPILSLGTISLTVYDPTSEERVTLPFSFSRAKWESRLNYRVNPSLCRKIRGYDRISTYMNANFEYWECIEDDRENILRGAITLPYREETSLRMRCLDSSLQPLDTKTVVLGNSKRTSGIANALLLRETQVSVRVPKNVGDLLFIIEDETHPEFNSFNTLPADIMRDLLHDTTKRMMSAQVDPDYPKWFKDHRAPIDVLEEQSRTRLPYAPLFSIVVPLYRTPRAFFTDMLGSVLAQSYGNWELILVNASPDMSELVDLARQATERDARVRLIELSENRGISENTNAGIAVATGDFVCFFDHDDLLEPDLLFEYAKAVNQFDDIDLLYCDEDKLMPSGRLAQPFFKPDFSIDLLRNNNYICHMLTIRKSLLDQLEPNTSEFDGAQDHNLTLEAVERARRVHHVPRILYHWRISETSTAGNSNDKPYATEAGIRAVQAHLRRMGLDATVEQSRRPSTYKVTYSIPRDRPLVSIIIPTKDLVGVLSNCVDSIFSKSTYENFEVVLVENNSEDPRTFAYYEILPERYGDRIRVIRWEHEFNYSKLVNFGAENARGDYLLLLNNDTEVITPSWLERMLGICAREDVGVVGARLYYPDDTIQHAGVCVTGEAAGHLGRNIPRGQWGYMALLDAEQDLSAVTAACMMVKRSVFDLVGGFTEEMAVAFNDVDFCLKVRETSKLVVYTPEVELYHYESISRGYEDNDEKRIRAHSEVAYLNYRWAKYYIKGDPYINVNINTVSPFNYYYHL